MVSFEFVLHHSIIIFVTINLCLQQILDTVLFWYFNIWHFMPWNRANLGSYPFYRPCLNFENSTLLETKAQTRTLQGTFRERSAWHPAFPRLKSTRNSERGGRCSPQGADLGLGVRVPVPRGRRAVQLQRSPKCAYSSAPQSPPRRWESLPAPLRHSLSICTWHQGSWTRVGDSAGLQVGTAAPSSRRGEEPIPVTSTKTAIPITDSPFTSVF